MVPPPFLYLTIHNFILRNMKIKLLLSSLLVVLLFGCAGESKKASPTVEEILLPPTAEYTGQDTTAIMNLVNQYVDLLKAEDYDAMTRMLYVYTGGNVLPYTAEQCDSLARGFKMLAVFDAQVTSFILRSTENNQVGITIQIIPDGNIAEGKGITRFYLNPVKFEDQWYLTILDKDAYGYEDLYGTEYR